MSINKILNPGFGIGTAFGNPVTTALAPSSTVTLTGTVQPGAGQFYATGLVTGIALNLISITNAITGTWSILNGAPGHVVLDGSSAALVNTTTSVNIVWIGT